MAWTTPRTWVAGELVTAAMLNTHLRDNENYLFGLPAVSDGAWTPTLTGTSGAPTHAVQVGHYVKIGRMVHVSGFVSLSSINTASGNVSIAGLPFPTRNVANAISGFAFGLWNLTTAVVVLLGDLGINSSVIFPIYFATAASANPTSALQWSNMLNTGYFEFKFNYVSETP